MRSGWMFVRLLGVALLLSGFNICFAQSFEIKKSQSPVEERKKKEDKVPSDFIAGTYYKPTYVLPYYYTDSPDNAVYRNHTPNNEQLKHSELKYQLSFKVPLWKNIYSYPSTLYFAYTQLSYWQLYNNSSFFRETNYEPELYLANKIDYHLIKNWNINFLNIGLSHESNGRGNTLERAWDRVYIEATSSTGSWMVSVKPWYIFHNGDLNHNSDIGKFLGYGRVLVGYKYHDQVFSIIARNVLESLGKRATAELSWSFPVSSYLKGYVQFFSGYGQSLIEYNHRTNSIGIGVAFSDWI